MKLKVSLTAMLLAVLLVLSGCSLESLAPEGAVEYSYETLSKRVDEAMAAHRAEVVIDFLNPAPDSAAVDADVTRILDDEFLPARFAEEFSWLYSRSAFHSTLSLDITYSEEAPKIDELADANGGLRIEEFTQAALESLFTGMIKGKETHAVRLYSGNGDTVQDEIDAAIDALNNESHLFCYYVDSIDWEMVTAANITELTVDLAFTEDRIPYGELYTVSGELDAVRFIADSWRAGERMATFIVTDPSWDHDTIFGLSQAAEANSGELASECTYFNGNMYPREGDIRIAEAWLTFPMMDMEVERRSAALSARVDELYEELKGRGITDNEELLRAIHDTVVELADYNDDIADATKNDTLTAEMYSGRTAYGALITGSTVCTGYARAFKALCDRFSIPCWVMYGESEGDPHAWNAVDMGDRTEYVDCTFDDTDGTARYFLFSGAIAAQDGYVVDEGYYLPEWMDQ